MLNEISPQFIDLIMANTAFTTLERAKAVVETLKWLDKGAPEAFDSLPGKYKFNMSCFVEDLVDLNEEENGPMLRGCGTACCIAGAIVAFEVGGIKDLTDIKSINYYFLRNRTSKHYEDLQTLFLCNNSTISMSDVTAKGAAKTLRRYIESGKVTWALEEQV